MRLGIFRGTIALIFFTANTQAVPVITVATNSSVPFTPFTVLANDLLQTSVAGVQDSGGFTLENSGGVPILNNGQFTIFGLGGNNPQLATANNNSWVQYNLNVSVFTLGYNVTNITSYGGWNDSGRDKQLFAISYSLVGETGFHFLDLINFDPPPAGPGQVATGVRAVFTTSLTGVDAIRFDFLNGQENGYAGYAEFDVLGSPVPEPGVFALMGFAASMVFWMRHHPKRTRG